MTGLLVSHHGYFICHQIIIGNTSETKTLVTVLQAFQEKINIGKPTIVAYAARLHEKIVNALQQNN